MDHGFVICNSHQLTAFATSASSSRTRTFPLRTDAAIVSPRPKRESTFVR